MARASKKTQVDAGLERCHTAAGMPAWRWGPEGYPYGYDSPEQEAVAKQQARDNGQSLAELKASEHSRGQKQEIPDAE